LRDLKLKLLTGAALSCVFAQGAYAADLPTKAPVYTAQPSPLYNWTGFYAGGNVGYSWGRSEVTADSFTFGVFATGDENVSPKGIIGGLQAGYNWQSSRNWVWGLETDFQWSGQKDSVTRGGNFDVLTGGGEAVGTGSVTVESRLSWLGTVRGRIGYVAEGWPNILWYGTGGLAYGRVKTSASASATGTFTDNSNCEGGCPFSSALSSSGAKIQLGWALGAGVEAALANKWTWKIEYLYVDLGTASGTVPLSGTVCAPGCTAFAGTATYSNRMTDSIVRVGLNYRFGP